jgi:hypothetical protein
LLENLETRAKLPGSARTVQALGLQSNSRAPLELLQAVLQQ